MADVHLPTDAIFHLALVSDWEAAQQSGDYRVSTLGRTLEQEGFIHTSYAHQVAGTAARFYGDVTEPLVLLVIDPTRLTSAVVAEPAGDELFPHIYGPINLAAVVEVREWVAG